MIYFVRCMCSRQPLLEVDTTSEFTFFRSISRQWNLKIRWSEIDLLLRVEIVVTSRVCFVYNALPSEIVLVLCLDYIHDPPRRTV
jgi:hypothetical protein